MIWVELQDLALREEVLARIEVDPHSVVRTETGPWLRIWIWIGLAFAGGFLLGCWV